MVFTDKQQDAFMLGRKFAYSGGESNTLSKQFEGWRKDLESSGQSTIGCELEYAFHSGFKSCGKVVTLKCSSNSLIHIDMDKYPKYKEFLRAHIHPNNS